MIPKSPAFAPGSSGFIPVTKEAIQNMIERYRKIQRERIAGEREDSGFTLIELLIVIVVMGILAAVVVFALGGVAGKSSVAACSTDAKTVQTAVSAFYAQNPGVALGTGATAQALLTGTADNGPLLQSWPSNTGYTIAIGTTGGTVTTQPPVMVTVTAVTPNTTVNFSTSPSTACVGA
jgi:general secretion pathway protein G